MESIQAYIAQYDGQKQAKLQEMYDLIRSLVPPGTTEKISWSMPTFYLRGNLVHFAVHKNHIGLYPGASGVEKMKDRLEGYAFSKGAIQFPLDRPLPRALIGEIVAFRVAENLQKTK